MNYYSHHIGDYKRDTAHLSLLEHGVYRQLLDLYYLSEKAIPAETDWVIRRLSARTDDERLAIQTVLKDFFYESNGWHQKRCDMEIREYTAKADVARLNGKLGGRPKKTQVVISGNPAETTSQANHEPVTINQEPVTIVKTVSGLAQAQTPPPEFLGDENESEIPGKARVPLASGWELPAGWGQDAEALGWKPDEILRESEKFRQYYVVGKGGGTRRGIKGWRQAWSNWLANAEKFTPIRRIA